MELSNPQLEIQMLAALVAVTCTLSGTFLVLRKMAMMSDAISHSILAGIAVAYIYTRNIHSPLLIIGAAATGLITVFLVEILKETKLVAEDSAIGLIFTALFSIGVIIISRHAGNVHIDIDAVLLGEIAFAPFRRLIVGGYDLGPISLYVMAFIFVLNILFISIFYKELKIVSFDPKLAAVLGISPGIIHYGLMGIVSITAVGAFDAVGSILVVALMVVPPLTAYLITKELENMLIISSALGVAIGILGYQFARVLDVSIAGSMATVAGILFMVVFIFSPRMGVLATIYRRIRQKISFAGLTLLIHLYNHEGTPEEEVEATKLHLKGYLQWTPQFTKKVLKYLESHELIVCRQDLIHLTEKGRERAENGLKFIGIDLNE